MLCGLLFSARASKVISQSKHPRAVAAAATMLHFVSWNTPGLLWELTERKIVAVVWGENNFWSRILMNLYLGNLKKAKIYGTQILSVLGLPNNNILMKNTTNIKYSPTSCQMI